MTWQLRVVEGDADRRAYVDLVNALQPEWPTSVEELAWEMATYPGGARFMVDGDAQLIGAASTGRVYSHAEEFERFWLWLGVLPECRRRGIGSALLAATSEAAARAGKTGFQGDCPVGAAGALRRRSSGRRSAGRSSMGWSGSRPATTRPTRRYGP
jgi:GNAT superfamily N-acetyltransferase